MRNGLRLLAVFLTAILFTVNSAFAQGITITGSVKSSAVNLSSLPSVSVAVKGGTQGAFTDAAGNFKITVAKLPVTLVFSSIGYQSQEVTVTDASTAVSVDLVPGVSLGQEVVVSATRTPQRILESPVSIERVGLANIRGSAEPNYYDIVKNLKGVDLTTSSLTFKTVGTRGFNGSGNLRFNQLVDGMDNQAPGLNFSVGSVVGPTELDVDNLELLPGASSALYGSGGTNGTLLLNSKNPFRYPGFSIQVKQGINHVESHRDGITPYYDWAMRWGKVIGEKFAFKVSGQYIKAQDWIADDTRNLLRNNVFSSIKDGNRRTDPNYDGVNVFGDEASVSMLALAQAARATVAATIGSAAYTQVSGSIDQMLAGGMTYAQIQSQFAGNAQLAPLAQYLPFLIPTSTVATSPYRGVFTGAASNGFVSRTGYDEKDLVDYDAFNLKLNGGLYYKITSDVEASLTGNWGTGTTVYTGADRYALKNLIMGQYKAEVKAGNWFLRAYTTQENSGDSYTATTAALFINNYWKPNATWFQQYTGTYSALRMSGANDYQAQQTARAAADQGRLLPGSEGFDAAFKQAINTTIGKGGARFDDASDLYHFEGQYNFKTLIPTVDVLVGANHRIYRLNSHGTIFSDTLGPININETGGYIQLQRGFFNDAFKLTGSVRYDKQTNFDGRFTPRATALIKVAPNNSIRLSYQTGYRFPSNQDQYINLLTGGANRLIGGIPEFETYFQFKTKPAFTSESIVAYRNSIATGAPNPALLQAAKFQYIKPERVNAMELGYRGLLTSKLLVDGYTYYSVYNDFIGRVAVGRGVSADPARAPIELASPFTTNNMSFVVNTTNEVKAFGWGLSANYVIGSGYEVTANVSSDKLKDVPANVVTFFNTPEYRFNIGLANANLFKNVGFSVNARWQDDVHWEGTFGTGDIPSFATVDGQISYKVPRSKAMFKLGGSNLFNNYYKSAFGNPQIGGLYYVSFSYGL